MAANPIDDLYNANRFQLTIGGTEIAWVQSVSGFTLEIAVAEENQTGIGPKRQRPGRLQPPEISITRLYGPDTFFSDWMADNVAAALTSRKDGVINLLDRAGETVGEWQFLSAFPTSWGIEDLSAENDDPVIENCTLVCEQLVRSS